MRKFKISVGLEVREKKNIFKFLREIFLRITSHRRKAVYGLLHPSASIEPILQQYSSLALRKAALPWLTVIIPSFDEPVLDIVPGILKLDSRCDIVIVNDNPSRKLVYHDLRVRILNNDENIGRSASRNMGAQASRDGILLFMDADVRLKDSDALRKIRKFYSRKENSGVIMKCQVLYNIDKYNSDEYTASYVLNEGRIIGGVSADYDYIPFTSDFFACSRVQFMKYPFDESFKLWGNEDVDFARGQSSLGARLLYNEDVYSYSYAKDSLYDLARKFLECGITLRQFHEKWEGSGKNYYRSMDTSTAHIFSRLIRMPEKELRNAILETILSIKRIEKSKKRLMFVPKDISALHSQTITNLINLLRAYGYSRLHDSKDVGRFLRGLNV